MKEITIETLALGVATVTLNRPEVHNALDDEVIEQLTRTFRRIGCDPAVRVVVLRSNGGTFSAGADLGWMQRAAHMPQAENLAEAMSLAEMLSTIERCPKPTIAAVQGPAMGGGVGLVAACDIAIASSSAYFCLSEVRFGLVPAVISPYVLAAIGERAARRYFLTAERLSAEEAQRLGLVHEIAAPQQLDGKITQIIAHLRKCGPEAVAAAKELIRSVARRPTDDFVVHDTAMRIARQRTSEEGREGIKAFLEKRKPAWVI
ncbi:MAG: enoyl-CoA hydratase/isomerase family protein [Rhodospirillales bacterium]|nr:enoyl-CoA hydratase/isomerase family protein [Rhodospirillales bacterium]